MCSTAWGFEDKPGRTRWTEPDAARGGVAILLNPYSFIIEMEPWHETHWTPHWMAVQITIRGEIVLVVNVYAPTGKAEPETLFGDASTSPAGTRRTHVPGREIELHVGAST